MDLAGLKIHHFQGSFQNGERESKKNYFNDENVEILSLQKIFKKQE